MTKQIAPYGSWKSPVSAQMLVADRITLGQVWIDGTDIYWSEGRPQERGRQTVMRLSSDGTLSELLSAPWNARTSVHEYGGGAFIVLDGTLFFSNFGDGRMYRLERGGDSPRPITPQANLRYADARVDKQRNRLVCVREDHTLEGREAINTIVSMDADNDSTGGTVLVEGADFYAWPRISPDGSKLSWLQWNHPNMPWDGCELWIGDFDANGNVLHRERLAGSPTESVYAPEWSPDGTLYFVGEETGWWNLYMWENGAAEPLHSIDAEFGVP